MMTNNFYFQGCLKIKISFCRLNVEDCIESLWKERIQMFKIKTKIILKNNYYFTKIATFNITSVTMFISKSSIGLILFYIKIVLCVVSKSNNDLNKVKINKCCEENEIYIDRRCTVVDKHEEWRPLFTSVKGQTNLQINYKWVNTK